MSVPMPVTLPVRPRMGAVWASFGVFYLASAVAASALLHRPAVGVAAVGVAAAGIALWASWRWPAAVAIAIVVLAPFQPLPTMVAQAAGSIPVLVASAMKELLMAWVVVAAAVRYRPRLGVPDVLLLLLLGVAVAHRCFGGTWLGIKDDLEFALPFAAGRCLHISEQGRLLWVKLALAAMMAVALLGLLEFVFVPPELRALWMALQAVPSQFYASGYEGARIASTLNGPAEFGLLCGFALVLFAAFRDRLSRRWWLVVPLLAAGLALSVTRSAWIGALLGLTVVEAKRVGYRGAMLLAGCLLAALFAAVLALGMTPFFRATTSGEETSLQVHRESLSDYSAAVWRHPLGSGPGTVGPRAVERSAAAVNPESSYLGLALGYGWLGGFLFVAFCWTCLRRCWRIRTATNTAASAMLLGYLAAMFVLPLHMSFSLACWAWFAAGMGVRQARMLVPQIAGDSPFAMWKELRSPDERLARRWQT